MSQLLTPVRIGRYDAGIPHDIFATYYAQRSTAGLIVTEGVYPSVVGKGEGLKKGRSPVLHGLLGAWPERAKGPTFRKGL